MRYRGRYEYSDGAALERALISARAVLEDDDVPDATAWLRFFVCRGRSLTVNLEMPATAELRFAAANVFLALAHGAVDGNVEALEGPQLVDLFIAAEA